MVLPFQVQSLSVYRQRLRRVPAVIQLRVSFSSQKLQLLNPLAPKIETVVEARN